MKKRIGNDITFTWHIYRKSGDTQVPESFTGKDVEVKLISPLQRTVTIEDVSIATGVVTFTFRGKHQVTLGNYVAVLLENKGENGMVTLDVVSAVTLVAHSYMEEDGDDGDVIEASSVELTSEIGQGIDAYTKAETDALLEGKYDKVDGIRFLAGQRQIVVTDENGQATTTISPNEVQFEEENGTQSAEIWLNGGYLRLNDKYHTSPTGNKIATDLELAGKQDTINDLAAIRSGAQAGATAYQKPQTGIPVTDLASEVQNDLAAIDGKADVGRVEDIEDALSVVESETADATDYTTETTSVSTDNITINPVAVRKSPIYSVYKQGGGQENIEGVFSPGYTDGSYILNVQIAQAGTVKIDSIRTRYYSGYYPIVYFYFTPTGGEKVKVAEIAKAPSGIPIGYKYEEPTVSINAPGAGVLSIELWLYDIDTYNTIPAFYWMKHESSSVVYYAITSISFEQSSLTGFVNNGAYNSTTKKIELKHDSDILAEIDATDIFDSDNYYDKNDVDGLLAGKANSADLAEVATSGSYNDLGDKPDLSGFITNSVDDLVNYYLKFETYTKTEVQQLIGAIQQFHYEVYPTLPQTGASNVLYLIGPTGTGADKYEEYVYANNDFTKIGDTSIDLSGYVTTQALNTALADYVTSSALSTTLANYYNKTEVDGLLASKANQSEMSVVPGTGANADKTTITLKQGTSATVLTTHQDISGKEDVTTIVTPVNTTDATLPITTLTCEVGKYYRIDVAVDTLAITLPTPTDLTKVSMVVVHLTAGTTPNVVIGSTETIDYSAAYDISASKEYEINCLFNGDKWVVADMEVV